jgi:hypothetical protein
MTVLLSSHRDYHTEYDWEWLRNDSPYADALVFEKAEDDKYQMVVSDRWRTKLRDVADKRQRAIDLMEATLLVICTSRITTSLEYGGMLVGEMMYL